MRVGSFLVALLPILGALAAPTDITSKGLSTPSTDLSKRVTYSAAFTAAVAKGKTRFNSMTALVTKDVERASTQAATKSELTELPAAAKAFGEAAPLLLRTQMKSFLSIDGTASDFYNIELKKGSSVAYDCDYNVKDGVIIVKNVDKKGVKSEPSEAMFWEYGAVATAKQGAVKNLKAFGVDQITNSATIALIKEIYAAAKKDQLKDDITLASGTDGFYAILGSENGSFAPYMLGDHPVSLGKKTISSILVIKGAKHDLLLKLSSV
ncbi:hypothetical protein OCU04_005377 [Sclerotinia nivalis]|uniref:Uncharacterized protein n=1 Tax=Sclerotinia nivalis TaxID=352851 RepID=A0A9X0ASF3_9HELO|nr:hypothetical protein OCU04_005377 [Sclerotinia nivalis]